MNLNWIDKYIDGLIEYAETRDVFEIYNLLDIKISKVDENNPLLLTNEATYIRSYFGDEIVFIREDIPYQYTKFILAHELGHAILHTEIGVAAYHNSFINRSKLEQQADYFAIKLLELHIDRVEYENFTVEQIASSLFVNESSLGYAYE